MKRSLHLITSGEQSLPEILRVVEAAVRGGVDYVHIREKTRTARELLEWIEEISQVMPADRLIVNDRLDVAACVPCGGAHLAWHSLPPQMARQLLPANRLLGQSVHSLKEALKAEQHGVSYVLYGHIYATRSKPGLAPRGTGELQTIAARLTIPLIGIGGIKPEHVPDVMAAGCAGVAVMSGITASDDPETAARAYREALDRFSH
ncbi:MAG: thiamine phosphate synthase [Brevibacillus sp.]|nr:thiamine phosphate synthase [Brevibacillus sp.]